MSHIFLFISLSDVEHYRKALIGDGIHQRKITLKNSAPCRRAVFQCLNENPSGTRLTTCLQLEEVSHFLYVSKIVSATV